jgi:hypothetical protein
METEGFSTFFFLVFFSIFSRHFLGLIFGAAEHRRALEEQETAYQEVALLRSWGA